MFYENKKETSSPLELYNCTVKTHFLFNILKRLLVFVKFESIRFKGKRREEWNEVEEYLKEYIGDFYEIEETSEKNFISDDFPDEYAKSESRLALKGAVAKGKANATQGIPELIQIATNVEYSENKKKRHEKDGKKYLYDLLAVKKEPLS